MDTQEFLKKQFSIIQEISNVIVVTDNISVIANFMLDFAINYTEAEKGSLMLTNEIGELYILAARGIDIELVRNYRVKIGEGIAGIVARDLSHVLVNDIDKDERFKKEKRDRYKTKSFISCPIVSRNKLLGVINTNDKRNGSPFTEDEFALIKIIANQAAIALENAYLVNQLKVKAVELEEMNRKLMEADVVKSEFLTRVSHELRTPLNSIKGSIYYLQQSSENAAKSEQKEFYGIISTETEKLASIVENQLDFLTLENEARVINKTVINLIDIFSEINTSRFVRDSLARKKIDLHIDVQDSLSDIVGDKIKIVQLFINLLEGLCFFLVEGDVINFTVTENDFIKVVIHIPRTLPENMHSYFNSSYLFHANQSEEKVKLSLARKIIEIHGWELNAKNRDGAFSISLTIPKSKRQKIEAAITTSIDLFLEFIAELLDLSVCSILLSDELTGDLTVKSARGLPDDVVKQTRIRPGDKISGWVACEGKPLLIEDIEKDLRFDRKNMSRYNTKSLLSLPLKIKDKVIGVLNLNNKKSAAPFTVRDLQLATVLSERISSFIEKFYAGEYREDEFRQFMTSFDSLINAEKKYTKKASQFPDLMMRIMDRLGVREEDKHLALYISMIYDLGLMLVDESLLKKKNLLHSEVNILKTHPLTTVGLLNNFESSEDVKKAILHHHEHYDGTGYPEKLKGEEIPFISRVLAVVDAFCSMISPRPYREEMTRVEALQEIKRHAGSIYDPMVVEALEGVFGELSP
jgi:HD-GYP domain-containing protein (c-di-GMP phosphodiesterase class II)